MKKMTVDKFVLRLHSSLDKISNLDMNDELKTYLLLRQANLDSQNRKLVAGAAREVYSLQVLPTSLWNAYLSESIAVLSMALDASTNKSRHISRPRDGLGKRAPIDSHKTDKNTKGTLVYAFLNHTADQNQAFSIIDSGACASEFKNSLLDRQMVYLNLKELRDELVSRQTHLFGSAKQLDIAIWAVTVPFKVRKFGKNEVTAASLAVKFGVINRGFSVSTKLSFSHLTEATRNVLSQQSVSIDEVDLIPHRSPKIFISFMYSSALCKQLSSKADKQSWIFPLLFQ